MSDPDRDNERIIATVLRRNLDASRAALVIAAAKLDKVAAIARRLRAEGNEKLAAEILEALS